MSEHDPNRDESGKWKPGTTGNRGGRPKGKGWHATQRQKLRESIGPVLQALHEAALKGDTRASALLLERCLPPMRAGDDPVTFDSPADTLGSQARGIMQMITRGAVTPAQGADLLGALANVGRIVETHELEARLQALEAAQAPKP